MKIYILRNITLISLITHNICFDIKRPTLNTFEFNHNQQGNQKTANSKVLGRHFKEEIVFYRNKYNKTIFKIQVIELF